MEPKEPKNARLDPEPGRHEQQDASELQSIFASLKTPWQKYHRSRTEHLSRIAAEMGVPPDRIADVLQEVWLDAANHHAGFQGEGAEERLSSWLDAVVRSKSRDALRRLGRRRREESLENIAAEPVDHKAKEPGELLAAKERAEYLAAQLEALRTKNPLNWHLVHEHILKLRALKDLAEETGLSGHVISCRIARILKKLRNRVRE